MLTLRKKGVSLASLAKGGGTEQNKRDDCGFTETISLYFTV